jgi:hypothetical protein
MIIGTNTIFQSCKVKNDSSGYYVQDGSTKKYLLFTDINDIGTPGAAGFGVGICPPDSLPSGFTPLSGYTDPQSPNYGNYQYDEGSVMVWIPKFYYLITGNTIAIKSASFFADTTAANAAGYALHRAFIDGGVEKNGLFLDKYMVSKVTKGSGYVAASIKNGLPLSTASTHNPIADLTASGGTNAYYRTIDCAHARDGINGAVNASSNFFVCSRFIHAALAMLAWAHGQGSGGTGQCTWYNATYNYPKGCNNNALRDTDDATVLYESDGFSNCGRTGSGSEFAKTTHNGQDCGVSDLNGLMYEISIGITCIAATAAIEAMTRAAACVITWTGHGLTTGAYAQIAAITQASWTALNDKIYSITYIDDNSFSIDVNTSGYAADYDPVTDPGTITKGTFYAAKQATAMKSFTSGNTAATDHFGATGVAAMMDSFIPPFKTVGGGAWAQRFGSGSNQVISEATSGANWLLTGLGCPKDNAGIDSTGTNLFGKDYFYQCIRNELCALSCGYWFNGGSGIWALDFRNYRDYSYNGVGWRTACYPV